MMKKTISVENKGEIVEIYLGFNGVTINIEDLKDKSNLQDNEELINFFITLISNLNNQYYQSTIQLFSPEFVISPEHIITAFYHTHKAFSNRINISSQKNIEFLLYLSTKRQISEAIKYFGIKIEDINLKNNIELAYLITSYKNDIETIKNRIIEKLNVVEEPAIITERSITKLQKIIDFFKISAIQISNIFNSYDKKLNLDNYLANNDINDLYNACLEIVYEKMALLSLEKASKD